MEFDAAARRLARDHLKGGRHRPQGGVVSAKAKREADYRKQQQEISRRLLEHERRAEKYRQQYMAGCDRALGIKSLTSSASNNLLLQPTSIHGEGDKVALPPSVLKHLSEFFLSMQSESSEESSPWTFRIGILRPDYAFPASPTLKALQADDDGDIGNVEMQSDSEDEDEIHTDAYLDELAHRYISYTHATVVEFTQEEGHIGLPEPISSRLLSNSKGIPFSRTQDPAGDLTMSNEGNEDDGKTPGHLAWGAFDVPSVPVEVTFVKLPKGRHCTLIPSTEALQHGFHNLKDVKLVLEQSLIRTRATLSVGDTVHTWHRGVKFDLSVAFVSPKDYQAVSCINTDIEVDIGENEEAVVARTAIAAPMETSAPFAPGTGHKLSDDASSTTETLPIPQLPLKELLPEPPADLTEGVCTVQIKAENAVGRRRFHTSTAKLDDLFAFACHIAKGDARSFQLVTRFPRRVFTLQEGKSLDDAGIGSGQEMFLLERT